MRVPTSYLGVRVVCVKSFVDIAKGYISALLYSHFCYTHESFKVNHTYKH